MKGEISPETVEVEMPAGAHAGLLLMSLVGAVLLAWWAFRFHHRNEQLWMVPAGLILAGTPALIWLLASASEIWRRLELSTQPPSFSRPQGDSPVDDTTATVADLDLEK